MKRCPDAAELAELLEAWRELLAVTQEIVEDLKRDVKALAMLQRAGEDGKPPRAECRRPATATTKPRKDRK